MRTTRSEILRATRTPEGPGTEHIRAIAGTIEVQAWGPGADWLCDRAPVLLGGNDDHTDFPDVHPLITRWHHDHVSFRTPATQAVWEALLPTILEQKVTGTEAQASYGAILKRFGEPAPGPFERLRLVLPPDPAVIAGTPSHVFHACGVERKRSDTIRRVAGYARRIEEVAEMPLADGYKRLAAVPGIGQWTLGEVGQSALGDSDALSVGDYHLKNWVAWNLAGQARGTDEQMLELLEPFRPFRGRVVRLLQKEGSAPPKYGPRLSIQPRW